MARPEDPTKKTIMRLYALSGNHCAFPGCDVKFLSPEDETNVSNICHIEAAREGGERYNPNSNAAARRSFENLILLCPNHHKVTDDVQTYTVEVLREMKRKHEARTLHSDELQKNPSALNDIIKLIGNRLFDTQVDDFQTAPNPQEKLRYNNVVRYKPIVEEYKVYQGKLNKLYEEIEKAGSTRKEFLLLNIRNIYLTEKAAFDTIDKIRSNADLIIDRIKDKLWELVENTDLDIEAIEVALLILIVDAFMRCNILEEPQQ
jgi:hypothetical protein